MFRLEPGAAGCSAPTTIINREVEKLKRRVIWCERAGVERGRQVSFLYRCANRFGQRLYPLSFCHGETRLSVGCSTGACCRCRPDVFAAEKELLDLLPQRIDNSGYCPFFNLTRKNCGIYGVRPLACRIYFNLAVSAHSCRNPNEATLQLFENLKPHLEKILGPYIGGYSAKATL
ncbi:MAG: zinc/iron-chelating domain-containing protein [Deltaproteobacteria bacterium HGW-Deltaproteobacteria-4]|nr:MAG: zinc/iron-chelating domain-containing protein [Deltaproteobacteria bacterium HGW-Deltaproteobacteria-4]